MSTNYFVYDGHGSTRLLTDNSGSIVNTFTYDGYGNLIASDSTPQTGYLYTGQQFDSDLDFYYLRARYYKPDTGRFWTMDTFQGDNEDPLSLHKYLYAQDNPVMGTDPSGHDDLVELMTTMTISSGLSAIVSPVVSHAFGAVVRDVVPRQINDAIESGQTPDALLLGVSGAASVGRYGAVVSGSLALEGLVSVHNLHAAAYLTPSVSVTTGKSGPEGSATAYGGLVWNTPASEDYAGNAISVTLNGKLVPQKFLDAVANQLTANALAMSSAPRSLPGSFPLPDKAIATLEQFKSNSRVSQLNNLSVTIFWAPGGSGAFGVTLGWDFTGNGGPRGTGGQAMLGWSYTDQIIPDHNVNFR